MPHSFNNIRVSLCSLTYAIQKGLFSSQSKTDDVLRRLYTQCCKFLAFHFKIMRDGHALGLNESIRNLICFSSLGLSLVRHVNKPAGGEEDQSQHHLSTYIADMNAFLASISLHWILALTHSSWTTSDTRESLFNDMIHLLSIPELVESSKGLENIVGRYVILRESSNGQFPTKPLPNMIPLKSPIMFASRLLLECDIKDHSAVSLHPHLIDALIKVMPETICDVDEDGSTPVAIMASLDSVEGSTWGQSSVSVMESMTAAASEAHGIADSNGDIPLHIAAACGNSAVLTWIIDHTPELASRQNEAGCCPLHLALSSLRDHPDASILRLLACFPEAASIADRHGYLPLHYAMKTASMHVIASIYDANPAALSRVTDSGSSCLHLSLKRSCKYISVDDTAGAIGDSKSFSGMCEDTGAICPIVEFVLARAPSLAALQDGQGQSPLHLAAGNPLITTSTVRRLLAIHPEATRLVDGENCLPLHYAASRVSHAVSGWDTEVFPASSTVAGGGEDLRTVLRSLRLQEDIIRELLRCFPAGANAENADGITPLDILRDHLRISSSADLSTEQHSSIFFPGSIPVTAAPSTATLTSSVETAGHIAVFLQELLSTSSGLLSRSSSAGPIIGQGKCPGMGVAQSADPECQGGLWCSCARSSCPWAECTAVILGIERLLLRADVTQDEERLRELNWQQRRLALMAWERVQSQDVSASAADAAKATIDDPDKDPVGQKSDSSRTCPPYKFISSGNLVNNPVQQSDSGRKRKRKEGSRRCDTRRRVMEPEKIVCVDPQLAQSADVPEVAQQGIPVGAFSALFDKNLIRAVISFL